MAEAYKEISIRDLIAPVFRRRRLIVLIFLGVFAAMTLLGLLSGPTYASRTVILVNRERQDPLVTTASTTQATMSLPMTEEEVNSEAELLTSRDILEQVVIENLLYQAHGFSIFDLLRPNQTKDDRIAGAVKGLAKKLKVEVVAKTNLIGVGYSSADPHLSYSVLKTLSDAYMAKHISVHRPTGSYDFFAKQTEQYYKQLQDAEGKLRDFGKSNGVVAPDLQRANFADQLATSTGLMHTAEQAVAADQERLRTDDQQMKLTPDRSRTARSTAAADKLLESLNTTLLAAETKRTQLAVKYEPTYPLVKEADQEIAQAKAAIAEAEKTQYVTETTDRDPTYELLREDRARTTADLAAQRATVKATKASIDSIQAEMMNLDRQSLDQQDLLRDAKSAENNYLLYLSKREQERTSDALDTRKIVNVAIAVPPATPVLPVVSWRMIILVSFVAALVISVGSAYTLDYLDSSFHTPAQVTEALGIPLVVAMPRKTA